MKSLYFLFFSFLILSTNPLIAQTIYFGKITNSRNEPIAFATVNILNASKNIIGSGISESNGSFKLNADRSIAVYIYASYLAQKSDTLLVGTPDSSIHLIINQRANSLAEVNVTATSQMITRQADRFVFTPNKLITKGAAAIDILKITPFIQFDNKSETFSIINKEGTTIYINGKKSNMPKEMILAELRSNSADNIKSIEIITNPGSEYQANLTGGIININLKRMVNDGLQGNISISDDQSKYNTAILNGVINYRKDKVAIRISPFINNSFNYNTSQNFIQSSGGTSQNNNKEYFRRYLVLGGGLGLDYDIDKNNLLSFNGFASSVSGKSRQSNETDYFNQGSNTVDSSYQSPINGKDSYLYNFGNLYYQHRFDSIGKKQLTVNIDYNQYRQTNTDLGSFTKITAQSPQNDRFYKNILPQRLFNISEGMDYSASISATSKINIGEQISTTRLNNNLVYSNLNLTTNNYVEDQALSNSYKYLEDYQALYVSWNGRLTKKLQSVIGLRAENIYYSARNESLDEKADSSYFALFPNLSLQYSASARSNFSISFSKKIKRPAVDLLFPGRTYINPTYFSENNPFLMPATTYNLEGMYSLDNKYYFSGGYNLAKNQYGRFVIPYEDGISTLIKKTYINYGDNSNVYVSFYSMHNFFNGILTTNFSAYLNFNHYSLQSQELKATIKDLNNLSGSISSNNTILVSKKANWLGFVTLRYNSPIADLASRRDNALFYSEIGLRKSYRSISLSVFVSDLFNTNGKITTYYQPNIAFVENVLRQNNYTRSISASIRYSFGNYKINAVKNKNTANEDIKRRLN